jgi:proteasome lid subunit RPN8/RPN11
LAIRVKQEHLNQIKKHGEETYPHECCGFLIGTNEGGANVLCDLYRADNEWHDTRADQTGRLESSRNRYLITPDQYRRADAYARLKGLGIIGYYHSHPDHPAQPSGFDLDHSCWPTESYIIVSVERGKAAALNSFAKPDYTHFEQEEIIIDE